MYDILIIGGGAAGLAAGAYALDKQLDVRVIAKRVGGKSGWQRHSSSPQPAPITAGEDVVRLLRERLGRHEDVILQDEATSIVKANSTFQVETKHHGREEALAVIVATGVTPVALQVPGGNDLLGYGLGYSAATHAQELHGTVAAIGASERTMRGVYELSRIARTVYWIGPSLKELISPLGMGLQHRHNVKVFEGYRVVEVLGGERVEAIVVERNGDLRRLDVDEAFVDLGLKPNTALIEDLVSCDADGFIQITKNGATSMPGLYAAGDITTEFGEQLLVAVGQGAHAAVSAYNYVLAHRV